MDLLQVNWDDEKNLFFEFEKCDDEKQFICPEMVKSLNFKFEISRIAKNEGFYQHTPSLVSVKKVFFTEDSMSFSIDLDELSDPEELQIKIIKLTILLLSGQKKEISIGQKLKLSEISLDEDCYAEYIKKDLNSTIKTKSSFTKEKIYQEKKTDFKNNKEKTTYIYEKSHAETNGDLSEIVSTIREGNEILKKVEQELQDISVTLKQVSLNNINYVATSPVVVGKRVPGFERKRGRPKKTNKPQQPLLFISELKTLIESNTKDNKEFDFRDVLKPLTEEELTKITLDEEKLLQKKEESISNEIKRVKKNEDKIICLENLKKPKL